jgi:RNA polymerase sigma factor (sigma-70 family)
MDKEHPINEKDLPRLLAKDLKQYSEQFVEYYWLFVRKLAYQLTRSDEDAEDLRQEVFKCVLQALERKTAEDIEHMKFSSYLRMATTHCYINMSRSKRKRRFVESLDTLTGMDLQEMLVDENTRERQPDVAFEDKELRHRVRELLNILPAQQRVAVMLRYGGELSYPSIARFLQISEDDAKSLVRDGKKKLKAEILAHPCPDYLK